METTNPTGINPHRYILVLNDKNEDSAHHIEQQLDLKLTSSAALNAKVRAQDVLDKKKGIHFKNLNIAVVDEKEEDRLRHLSRDAVYWEKEREFFPITQGADYINDIRQDLKDINQRLDALEAYLKNQPSPKEPPSSSPAKLTWGLQKIGILGTSLTRKDIDICVLDTGFYADHPDFAGRNIAGKSFVRGENWDYDGNGHGTHTSGTALGNISSQNGVRYGVAKEANLVMGKVLSNSGSGATSNIVDAIDWAIEKKFPIVSMSLGSPVRAGQKPSAVFEQAGNKALNNNVLLIAAAGNGSHRPNGVQPVSSPANAQSIMAVAAVNQNMTVAPFSNAGIYPNNGGAIDLAGPGVEVYSSYSKNAPGGKLYNVLSGTSMATPHVSGTAALCCQAHPEKSAAQIWLALEKQAKVLQNQLTRDVGSGLVQVP